MDKEKLGRALGYAARHGARSLRGVAEAATAPDPRARARQTTSSVAQTAREPAPVRSAKAAGRSVWKPLAKFSSVLWLEVTGFFFAVFAAAMGHAAWGVRRAAPGSSQHTHFVLYAALAAGFAYFAVSSFVRARRRERR